MLGGSTLAACAGAHVGCVELEAAYAHIRHVDVGSSAAFASTLGLIRARIEEVVSLAWSLDATLLEVRQAARRHAACLALRARRSVVVSAAHWRNVVLVHVQVLDLDLAILVEEGGGVVVLGPEVAGAAGGPGLGDCAVVGVFGRGGDVGHEVDVAVELRDVDDHGFGEESLLFLGLHLVCRLRKSNLQSGLELKSRKNLIYFNSTRTTSNDASPTT